MPKSIVMIVGASVFLLSGCVSEKESVATTNTQTKTTVMGDGNNPRPKASDYANKP